MMPPLLHLVRCHKSDSETKQGIAVGDDERGGNHRRSGENGQEYKPDNDQRIAGSFQKERFC